MEKAKLETVARMLVDAQRLVVLTGAGMSKESGVPTFREAHDGLWARYDPTSLATPGAFRRNPKLVWDWYTYRRELIAGSAPNPGHHALVALEDLLPQVVIVTQNVDGFHQQVGSSDVICLHGNIQENKCFDDCQGKPTLVDISRLEWDAETGPPTCPYCRQALVRPNVVWFNETLPVAVLERAQQLSQDCDVMLVIGTSGVVYPAAYLPMIAHQSGATVLEINPSPSGISQIAVQRLAGGSGELLPLIVDLIRQLKST
ncbi:MAG: NAD-dependent deacylase [Chloroflexi bacterium]|nr:NAD-dependent deacylase [Chloroflexota bacterium]